MKQTPNPKKERSLALPVATAALLLMGAAVMAMAFFYRWQPLWLCALILLLPAVIRILTVRIWLEEEEEESELPEEKKPGKLTALLDRFFAWLQKRYAVILAVLVAAAIAEGNVLFWSFSYQWEEKNIAYLVPLLLAVMFVISIIIEKWCRYTESEDPYILAVARTLRSGARLAQIALLVTAVVLMLKLLGLFDATGVLKVLLSLLFVYETVFLTISLFVRMVRREMLCAPEFVIPLPGVGGGDMHILTYLEENTGITMRSLWSMRLIKQIIPCAAAAVAVLLWLSTGLISVSSWQEGVVYRLGRLQERTLAPGVHLVLPWPFDKVEVYDTETVEQMTIGYIPTGDQDNIWTEAHGGEEYRLLLGSGDELVSINLRLEYRIEDVLSYVKGASSPEAILQAEAYKIITQRTIATDLETMLSANREVFSESFRESLVENLEHYDTGLAVVGVVLESIHPPVEVATVYQKIISAGIEAEQIIIEAQNQANTTVLNARDQHAANVSAAQVGAAEGVANAQSAVAEFMASVSADQSFHNEYRFYKYLNALTKAYSGANLVIVGQGIDSSNLYLGSLGQTIPGNQGTTEEPTEPSEPIVPEATIPGMDVD